MPEARVSGTAGDVGAVGPAPALRCRGLAGGYGRTQVVADLDIEVPRGSTVAVIGPNGAGKTTTLRLMAGVLMPTAGTLDLMGRDVTGWPAHRMASAGLALVPEDRALFDDMPVIENLRLGGYTRRRDRLGLEQRLGEVLEMFPVLADRRAQLAGTLSGGEKQMLTVARALLSDPKLLLLDEPSSGLAPLVVDELYAEIEKLNGTDLTVLIVEQSIDRVLEIADYVYVMRVGEIVDHAHASSLRARDDLLDLYLG